MSKVQIRQGVFETNSSSEHSISISNTIVILSDQEYQNYLSGNLKITCDGKKMSQEDFDKEIEKIKKQAKVNWENLPSGHFYNSVGQERYIKSYIESFQRCNDIKKYGTPIDVEETWAEREINGEVIHVLSMASGEEY